VSLYFYLNVAKAIYLQEPVPDAQPIPVTLPLRAALYFCLAAIIGLGIFQRPLVEAAVNAAAAFHLK